MRNITNSQLREILNDCCTDKELSSNVIDAVEHGRIKYACRRLHEYRTSLLDRLHDEQKRLETLDYLLNALR